MLVSVKFYEILRKGLEYLRRDSDIKRNYFNMVFVSIKSESGVVPGEREDAINYVANKMFNIMSNAREYYHADKIDDFYNFLKILSEKHNVKFGKIFTLAEHYEIYDDNYSEDNEEERRDDSDEDYEE